jgi:hypothetical protein
MLPPYLDNKLVDFSDNKAHLTIPSIFSEVIVKFSYSIKLERKYKYSGKLHRTFKYQKIPGT